MSPRRRPIATLVATLLTWAAVAVLCGPAHDAVVVHADGPDAIIVGDSLTGGNQSYIRSQLQQSGLSAVRVEGLSGRRIGVSFDFKGRRDSGIARVRMLRAAGVDSDLWVIQLGTNDLGAIENCRCPSRVGFALSMIQDLVDEIGRDASIAWVTVHDRERPAVADDFNTAVYLAALAHPRMTMIQWKRLAVQRPDWFLDDVHPNIAGLRAFTEMYVADIGHLIERPFDRAAPQIGPHRAERVPPGLHVAFGRAIRPR